MADEATCKGMKTVEANQYHTQSPMKFEVISLRHVILRKKFCCARPPSEQKTSTLGFQKIYDFCNGTKKMIGINRSQQHGDRKGNCSA
jgi:hypothetical protein